MEGVRRRGGARAPRHDARGRRRGFRGVPTTSRGEEDRPARGTSDRGARARTLSPLMREERPDIATEDVRSARERERGTRAAPRASASRRPREMGWKRASARDDEVHCGGFESPDDESRLTETIVRRNDFKKAARRSPARTTACCVAAPIARFTPFSSALAASARAPAPLAAPLAACPSAPTPPTDPPTSPRPRRCPGSRTRFA